MESTGIGPSAYSFLKKSEMQNSNNYTISQSVEVIPDNCITPAARIVHAKLTGVGRR
jgi:hypothetical protein